MRLHPLLRLSPLLAASLLASACGPETSSALRMTGHPVDVLFGNTAAPSPAAAAPIAPGANPQPHFPSVIEPPLPAFDQPTPTAGPTPIALPPSPSSCPSQAAPGVKEAAPPRIGSRPVARTYVYTRTGLAQRTFPTPAQKKLDAVLTRTVSATRDADETRYGTGAFNVDVTEVVGQSTLVNTYLVSPEGALAGQFSAGLYLAKITSTAGTEYGTDVFAPTTPLELMPFPAFEGATWHSVASDPMSQASIEVSGTVTKRKRLNFCGKGVDSWEVQMTGQIGGPGRVVSIDNLVLDVGTQYGGLVLHDELSLTGTDADGQYQSRQATSIATDPDVAP